MGRASWVEHLRLAGWLLRPRTLFLRRSSKAVGDNLLLTALLPGLRARHPGRRIVVETEHPELFQRNPHVAWATRAHLATTRRHLRPRYRVLPGEAPRLYRQLLDSAGLRDEPETPPELRLAPLELAAARRDAPGEFLCVGPCGKGGFCGNRKEWGLENFAAALRGLSGLRFIQLGAAGDPLLPGVLDRRGRPLREAAALLAVSRGLLGLEGGLMHLARAVGAPATIVYGGLVAARCSAWPGHEIVAATPPCSPCFSSEHSIGDCETMECMKAIEPAAVVAAVRRMLAATGERAGS